MSVVNSLEVMSSIREPMDTIFVKSVKPRSLAHTSGLRIGDRLLSVNGDPITGKSYSDVVQLIKFSKDSLVLSVVPRQDDILQMYFSEIASNPESNQNQVSCILLPLDVITTRQQNLLAYQLCVPLISCRFNVLYG